MMKRLILFLALIFSAGCVTETTHSQQQPMVTQTGGNQCIPTAELDWQLQGLKGEVKIARTFKTWFSKNEKTGKIVEGEQELEEEFRYDSKGNQTAWENTNYLPADSKNATTTAYTCVGKNIAEVKLLKKDGSLIKRTTYGYDDNRNKIEEALFFPDGTLESRQKYTLDAKGDIVEEISAEQVHPEHFNPKRYDAYVTTKRTFKRDDRGNAIEEKHFYPDGSLYGTWVYTFDSADRLIKTVRTDKKNRLEDLKIKFFDDAGRLLEELSYSNSCYTKNDEMCEGSLNTDIGVFNTGWKTVFTYDAQDNWVKQIEYQIFEKNGEKSFEPSTALYRRLTY